MRQQESDPLGRPAAYSIEERMKAELDAAVDRQPRYEAEVNPLIINLRWHVVSLILSYLGPQTFGQGRYPDPLVQGAVNYGISAVVGLGLALFLLIFFTSSQQGKLWRNFNVATLVMSAIMLFAGWHSCSKYQC